jgi:hypothetical protein
MKYQEFLHFHDTTVNTILIYPQNYNKIKKKSIAYPYQLADLKCFFSFFFASFYIGKIEIVTKIQSSTVESNYTS